MTGYAELVTFGVSEVRAIVVGVVLRPKPRFALRRATAGERDGVSFVNDGSRLCQERDHLTVTCGVLPIKRSADEEERSGSRMRLPTSPRAFSVAEALLHTYYGHQRSIEGQRAFEVFDADEDVREQACASVWIVATLNV